MSGVRAGWRAHSSTAPASWVAGAAAVTALFSLLISGAAAADAKNVTLKVGYFTTYLPAEIEANILATIVSRFPSLGVAELKLIGTDVTASWIGIQRGDVDVLLEADLPNQQSLFAKAQQQVDLVSEIYGDAEEGFFVPRYVVEASRAANGSAVTAAPAPGLKSIDQLGKYSALFGGKLYDESPGWKSTKDNDLRLQAYGIDFDHVKLPDAALVAQVSRSIERQQPIVFFFSHPHWLFKTYDLVKLAEPNPYHAGCFDEGGDARCAVPSFTAWVAARKDLTTRAPRFAALLKSFKVPMPDLEVLMFTIVHDKQPVARAAAGWVDAHRAEVEQWTKRAASAGP